MTYLAEAIHLARLYIRGLEGRGANKNLKTGEDLVRTTVLINPAVRKDGSENHGPKLLLVNLHREIP